MKRPTQARDPTLGRHARRDGVYAAERAYVLAYFDRTLQQRAGTYSVHPFPGVRVTAEQ